MYVKRKQFLSREIVLLSLYYFLTCTLSDAITVELEYSEHGDFSPKNVSNKSEFYETSEKPNPVKISNGKFASPGQFPWMAIVYRLDLDVFCSGTIISRRWILTAGHCLKDSSGDILVVLGDINKNNINNGVYNGPGVSMLTSTFMAHPKHITKTYDIGLIFTPQQIQFTYAIQPIRLAGQRYVNNLFNNKIGYVIGWGLTGPGSSTSPILKYGVIQIIPYNHCSMYYPYLAYQLPLCSAPFIMQPCQGDSGSPLVITDQNTILQIGIVIIGSGDCPSSTPTAFTRVPSYIRWIEHITGLQF